MTNELDQSTIDPGQAAFIQAIREHTEALITYGRAFEELAEALDKNRDAMIGLMGPIETLCRAWKRANERTYFGRN